MVLKLTGHQKFECKADWISKFLIQDDIFNQNLDVMIEKLGLGKNMIDSLKFWLKILNIYDEKLTSIGKIIKENDLYLENKNTLFLLHYLLSKTDTIYNLFFNKLYLLKFNKELLFIELNKLIKANENTLKNDIDVFLRNYRQGLFKELEIFSYDEFYRLNLGKNIDDKLFLFVVLDIFEMKNSKTLEVSELEKGKISLLQIFLLNENSFFAKINNIDKISNNAIEYRENAGFKTLFLKEKIDKFELLKDII